MHPFPNHMMLNGGASGYRLILWGYNSSGQIGNGSTATVTSPVQIGPAWWSDVAFGDYHTLAIRNDGTLWSWGANSTGQLGNSTTSFYSSPIQIGALKTWTAVWAGCGTSFATRADGTLWAWGANNYGQLGRGNTTNYSSPVQVGALTNWGPGQAMAGASCIAFIKGNGTLWAWGRNTNGQLGRGNTINYSSPVQVGALTNWSTIGGGSLSGGAGDWVVATRTDGTLWAWGTGTSGQLGDGTFISKSSPIQIGALTDWAGAAISRQGRNGQAVAIIKPSGTLWAWGYNGVGNLGDGTTISRQSPVQIGALTTWWNGTSKNATMAQNGLGVARGDGTLWGSGTNTSNAGFVYSGTSLSPVQVGTTVGWQKVGVGSKHKGGLVK